MYTTDGPRSRRACVAGFGLVALLLWACALPGQAPVADPVERLRVVLLNTADDASTREQKVRECVEALRGVGELRRAVLLSEWKDRASESGLTAIDRNLRQAAAERLLAAARDMLGCKDPSSVNLALDLLVETAADARAKGEPPGLARALTPEVIGLVKHGEPRVRLAAVKALGQIDADPSAATPVLGDLLSSNNSNLRRAAADGLANLLQSAVASAAPVGGVPRSSEARCATVVLANTILATLHAAGDDAQAEVRVCYLAATARTATGLHEILSEAPAADMDGRYVRPRLEEERGDLRPLLMGMRDQLPALAKALRDNDVDVRLTALTGLEAVARVRWRWVRQGVWLGGQPPVDDPLHNGMQTALSGLARALTDRDVRVRRTALDVLAEYGSAAAPAAPAAARALADGDRFVRWTAVRALVAIGEPALPALPALANLLDDEDADVARAAVAALVALDPTGKGVPPSTKRPVKNAPRRNAVPALARAVQAPDTELRLAAIRALQGMRENARPAVPALCGALGDAETRVRQAAAAALGELGPVARDAVPDLSLALKDPDATVRRAAGDALLLIRRSVEP